MLKTALLSVLFAGLVLAPCLFLLRTPTASLTEEEAGVYEALVRWNLGRYREEPDVLAVYFLVDNRNPPGAFFDRFAGTPEVRPGGAYRPDAGIRISASRIKWHAPDKAEVIVEEQMSSRRAAGTLFGVRRTRTVCVITLTRKEGHWTVGQVQNILTSCG